MRYDGIQHMDVIQKARTRHAELKAMIEAADAVRPEYERLGAFLQQAEEIERQEWNTQPPSQVLSHKLAGAMRSSRAFGQEGEFTADIAEQILYSYGPRLHINELQERMYANGWRGSGDKKKDYKNLFENLSNKPKRFTNIGGATFELAKRADSK